MNFFKEGDVTHFNRELTNCHIQRVWNELLEKCHYEKRREIVDTFNRSVVYLHGMQLLSEKLLNKSKFQEKNIKQYSCTFALGPFLNKLNS